MGAIYKGGVYREMTVAEEAEYAATQTQIADGLAAQQEKTSRQMRDSLLADCDWTQASDSPLASAKKTAWGTYRAALRNLPTADSEWPDPEKITWPTEPS
jgi:hypothetical protein